MTDTAIHLSNNAPLVDVEAISTKHREAFVAASDVLRAEADLPVDVAGPNDLEKLAAHVRAARSARTVLDACRTTEKKRFDDAGKEVQGIFTPRLTKLEATQAVALGRINIHNRKVEEEQRVAAKLAADAAREEANRRAEAAAAIESKGLGDVADTVMDSALEAQATAQQLDRVANGSAADLVRTTTAGGTVTSATSITFEIADGDALRASLGGLGPFFTQPDIEKTIRAYVAAQKRQGKTVATIGGIAGVRFYEDRSARVR